MKTLLTLSLSVIALAVATAEQAADQDRWRAFEYLVGSWTANESASFGEGRGERSYEFVLQDRYLLGRNHSVFPPQDGLPEGDVHDDWTMFSYDADRGTYIVRQFNSEGFVNTFALQDPSTLPQRAVFVLEASENASGARGSLTYERRGEDAFDEGFEVTLPGAAEAIVIRNRWTRTAR